MRISGIICFIIALKTRLPVTKLKKTLYLQRKINYTNISNNQTDKYVTMKKLCTLLLCLWLTSFIYAPVALVHPPEQELGINLQTISKSAQTELRSRCVLLNTFIQEIAQKISSHTITTFNSKSFTAWLTQLSKLLTQLNIDSQSATTHHELCLLVAHHTLITNSIYQAFKTSFTAIPADLTAHTRMAVAQSLCGENPDLDSLLENNEILLHALPDLMQTHGLSSLNYAYNKVSSLIQAHPLVAKGAAALTAFLMAYRFKQTYYRDVPMAPAIIDGFSALTPADLAWTLGAHIKNPRVQTVAQSLIAAGLVGRLIVGQRTLQETMQRVQKKIHTALSGEPAKNSFNEHVLEQSSTETIVNEKVLVTHDNHTTTINEMITYLLAMPEYQKAGIYRPKTILFTGKPGNGKTVRAQQVQTLIKQKKVPCAFIEIKAEDMHHGQDLVDSIEEATRTAPCVIFIDEFHLKGYGLQMNGNKELLDKMLNFIQELNTNNRQIILIAATSRPDLLDEALLRDGRFTVETFQDPTYKERNKMLHDLCQQSAVDATTLDLNIIAHLTTGCSRSTINLLFKTATFKAKINREPLGNDHLYEALNAVVRKLQPTVDFAPADHAIVAAHVAGIALLHLVLQPTNTVLESVTTRAAPKKVRETASFEAHHADIASNYQLLHGGVFTYQRNERFNTIDAAEKEKQCKLTLAGLEAQKVLLGASSNYCSNDYAQAYQEIIDMLSNNIPLDALAEKDQQHLKEQAKKLFTQYQEEVRALLTEHKAALAALSQALQAQTFLTRSEIDRIVKKQTV